MGEKNQVLARPQRRKGSLIFLAQWHYSRFHYSDSGNYAWRRWNKSFQKLLDVSSILIVIGEQQRQLLWHIDLEK